MPHHLPLHPIYRPEILKCRCELLFLEVAQWRSYEISLSRGRRYALGYRIAILALSFVMGLVLTTSLWIGLIFELPHGSKGRLLRYWIYSVFLVGYFEKINMTESETEVVSWYGLKGGEHCLRYATREYTARLTGEPFMDTMGQEGMMQLCRETPTVIHDETLFTDFCQDLVRSILLYRVWMLTFNRVSDAEYGDTGLWISWRMTARRSGATLLILCVDLDFLM